MSVPPAFQFYASDWAHSVSEFTLEERGAYITLLAWSWERGPVPNDLRRIALILHVSTAKAKRVWEAVRQRWLLTPDDVWINARLERTRDEAAAFRSLQSQKGKASANARRSTAVTTAAPTVVQPRYQPGHQPNGQPETQPDGNSPISDLRSPISRSRSIQNGSAECTAHLTVRPAGPQALADAWNELTARPIPKCRELTKHRKQAAQRRLSERPLDDWRSVIARIQASTFCQGEGQTGWVATFDWLLKPDTATKVLEGKYDNRDTHGQSHSRTGDTMRAGQESLRARLKRLQAEEGEGHAHGEIEG